MKIEAYLLLMGLQLTAIAIKYGGSTNNPFQSPTPSTMLFLTSACCHVLSLAAQMNLTTTLFIFHTSGVVGCEALAWILVDEFLSWWYILNLILLLVASFCFNYKDLAELIRGTGSDTPNMEAEVVQI